MAPEVLTSSPSVEAPGFPQAARPRNTHVRHKVLAMTMALGAITYLDRVSIAVSRPYIARDLDLSPTQMGYVFSAFYVAYALFEIPTGWWGDRVGTRRVLTRIVCWWSAFTVLTGFAFSYSSLLVIRFLFGSGEAGAWPNVARTFSRWFPRQERGTTQGAFFMAAHLSGGLTPMLVTALLVYFDWRSLFVLFGSIGFVWAWGWYWWFRDSPGEHPGVGAAERTLIESGLAAGDGHALDATHWKRLLANRTVVCLCLMYFTQAFGGTFYVTWLPTYLAARGLSGMTAGILAGLPLILSAAADLLGGMATDRAARRLGLAGCGLSLHPRRHAGRIAGGRGGADCVWRRVIQFPARRRVGNVPGHRRSPLGCGQRGDEHIRAGWVDPQPGPRGRDSQPVLGLERAALPCGRIVPARRRLLGVDRSDQTRFRLTSPPGNPSLTVSAAVQRSRSHTDGAPAPFPPASHCRSTRLAFQGLGRIARCERQG
jgi:MFS family permease